ncbi:MAG: fatty acid kinase fatty acid binding subunit [Chloroflexota bacterium]|nr:fatty acid kinase fatty acid binding subunit [Chloroflexota bacterium]
MVDSGAVIVPRPEQGVHVVPLRIAFGDRAFHDGVDMTAEEFYARLAAGETPTTSTPSPGEYLEAFRAADADHVVCLTIPASLSAMHDSATLAARLLADEQPGCSVEVIDSGNAAAGHGLVARAAAFLCAAGEPLETVRDRVLQAGREVRMYGSLSTLQHLARSGRVPSIAAGISDLVGVRPIFELRDAQARRAALVRGRRGMLRSFQRLALEHQGESLTPVWLLVVHAAAPEAAALLRDALHQVLPVGRSEVASLTPVMGAYTGPGMTGFAAMPLRGLEAEGVP